MTQSHGRVAARLRERRRVEAVSLLIIQVRRHVPRLAAAFDFVLVGLDRLPLNFSAAGSVDGVGDVGVQLGTAGPRAVALVEVTAVAEATAALVAVAGPQVVALAAVGA